MSTRWTGFFNRRAEAQTVTIQIGHCEFTQAPGLINWRVMNRRFRPLPRVQTACAKSRITLIHVIHKTRFSMTLSLEGAQQNTESIYQSAMSYRDQSCEAVLRLSMCHHRAHCLWVPRGPKIPRSPFVRVRPPRPVQYIKINVSHSHSSGVRCFP